MSKILNVEKIKQWDSYTIENEPISSKNLMERAATSAFELILKHHKNNYKNKNFHVFCGTGNNGGDGLVIARKLIQLGCKVNIYIIKTGNYPTDDFKYNLDLINDQLCEVYEITSLENIQSLSFDKHSIVIDAILGSGINRKVTDIVFDIIQFINNNKVETWAIDIPSGMYADKHSDGLSILADYTISFQVKKLAFYFAENEERIGKVLVVSIGLHQDYYNSLLADYQEIRRKTISKLLKPRTKHSHKGTYGHAFLIAGAYGKMGAALLAAKSCLRAGVGLLTTHIPKCGYDIMQISVPEAMVVSDNDIWQISNIHLKQYDAIGIGPGIGTSKETYLAFKQLLMKHQKPIVIDADALNILAYFPDLQSLIPKNSILTPHPKEFERLFGASKNEFERFDLLKKKARELNVIIVLKGAHTLVASPDEKVYFNTSGNPGMATAGSGDVLTGIILSLLAQQYSAIDAAKISVYLHGKAGDCAAVEKGQVALIASDIVKNIGNAFQKTLLTL